jgi:hypothetical protein
MGFEWSWFPGETTVAVIYAEWMLRYQIGTYCWFDRDTNGEESMKRDGGLMVAHISALYKRRT